MNVLQLVINKVNKKMMKILEVGMKKKLENVKQKVETAKEQYEMKI